jgi:exonuclease SbcD
LHTADWHLGLRLYKKDIYEEHRFFFSWLLDLIREREIDVLMISGDIFDQANPTNEARALYYEFLVQLIQRKCKVIITGGNHDSPGILNAPKEILEMLDVQVIGSASAVVTEEIIDLGTVVIAAVHYLREPDIHALTKGIAYDDRRQQVRDGIRRHYDLVAEACASYDAPVIAMGHLYAAGSSTTDSERLIQMGNQSAVGADDFSSRFSYVALGHIHRPQIVNGQQHIRYSGSPVPLSFSERDDSKIVIELEIKGKEIVQVNHQIPVFRELVRFKGTLKEVMDQAESYKKTGPAKAFGELHIEEETMDPAIYADAARFVADWESEYIDIVNYGISIKNDTVRMGEFSETVDLREIQPLDVITRMMDSGGMGLEDQALIRNAFLELLGMDDENDEE